MSPKSKQEYFEALHKRYKGASRKEKTVIIDECCAICGYHRKHAIRRLKGYKRFTKPKPKKRGKPVVYNKDAIIKPLKSVPLSIRFFTSFPLPISGWSVVIALTAATVVGVVFGTIPASRAAQMDPVESLKYE